MNQAATLENCSKQYSSKDSLLSSLVFQSKSFDSQIVDVLNEGQFSVLKIESFTELVFHSRSFHPHVAFIGIDIVQLDHVDITLIRQKLPGTYLYLLIEEGDHYNDVQEFLKLGFDDFWVRCSKTLHLLPLKIRHASHQIKQDTKENESIESKEVIEKTANNFQFIECLSNHLMQPMNQLVQFAHIALQRNQRQQFSQVGHYLAEMKLISEELKAYIQDLKELLCLKVKETSLELKEIDLTELMRKIKRQFVPIAESHHIHLEFLNHTEQPYAKGDFSKLSRVLNLLLRDLIKAMAEKEKLTIDLKQVNSFFEIVIKASSLIFRDQLCAPLFELFDQKEEKPSKKGGDFGLSLCKELMKRQRGDLILSHEHSQQTTQFVLKIPCLNSLFED